VKRFFALVTAIALAGIASLAFAAPAHGVDAVDAPGPLVAEVRTAREPAPDAEMLLDLDLLKDAGFAKQRDLLRRLKLLERLRLLESLHVLEGQVESTSGTTGASR